MRAIHSQEENRRAACAKLAEIAKVLNDSLTSVNNKLIRLATDGYDTPQRAIASVANYQTTGLLCADGVREAEALLRGEPIEAVVERERDRRDRLADEEGRRDLLRDGLIRVPGDTIKAEVLCRCIIERLGRLTEEDLDAFYDDLIERTKTRSKGRRSKRAASSRGAVQKPTPFRVIEGGYAQ